MKRIPDCKGYLKLFLTENGGRSNPIFSGYQPQHAIYENYQASAKHYFDDIEKLSPGDSTLTLVYFLMPEIYPRCLWIGRKINLFEGSKLIGVFTVTEIVNEILSIGENEFYSFWVAR